MLIIRYCGQSDEAEKSSISVLGNRKLRYSNELSRKRTSFTEIHIRARVATIHGFQDGFTVEF